MRPRLWTLVAPLLLLIQPATARADFGLDSGLQAVMDVLPTWIFALVAAILSAFLNMTVDPVIMMLDINGDGV